MGFEPTTSFRRFFTSVTRAIRASISASFRTLEGIADTCPCPATNVR